MASNYTQHVQLPLWEPDDDFLRLEFNEMNQKLDSTLETLDCRLETAEATMGNCQYVYGSYTGTGTYGRLHKNILTFDSQPLMILISGGWQSWFLRGPTHATAVNGSNSGVFLSVAWENSSVSWYSTDDDIRQLNEKDKTYYYMAILDAAESA